jgi:hypothetical protein
VGCKKQPEQMLAQPPKTIKVPTTKTEPTQQKATRKDNRSNKPNKKEGT